ncbi:MAG TPA: EAL domain-containing protein [Acidiferrobacteraceae bacterium]|nr:EAL domain-containing protein [Acidiferrobacteraceae bacterium]
MNLRTKLFVPLIFASLVLGAYAYFYALPNYIKYVQQEDREHLTAHLSSVAEGLIPLLLENQLATIYDSLDTLLKKNEGWVSIILLNKNQELLYPLREPSTAKHPDTTITLEQKITFLNHNLGHLSLVVDLSNDIDTIHIFAHRFVFTLLGLLVIFVLAAAALLEFIVRRPVQQLAAASDRIADGDFTTTLPSMGSDEVGKLVKSFSSMRSSIRQYQSDLKQEMQNHMQTAKALFEEKERFSYHARHDPLTGLLNRREFESRTQRTINDADHYGAHHAMLYMDLDQFKVVNDTCGHVAGDEMLKQISLLLSAKIRQGDTLARLGGDEFGLLLEYCPIEHAVHIADTIRSAIQDFRFSWQGNVFSIGVSTGVVAIDGDTASIKDVFSTADTACYMAKDKGRNRIHVYQADDAEVEQRHGEMRWVSRINRALEDQRFVLFCQPIVASDEQLGGATHYEILVRMVDKNGATIPPGAFIPAAERYNLMPSIDRWVITELFSKLAEAQQNDIELPRFSVNLSGTSLSDDHFMSAVSDLFEELNIPPHKICFEITETAAIADLTAAMRFVNKFKHLGCEFSLDDFGSGLSSFGYLKTLPVDYLKIDGSFIKDIATDPIDLAMVKSINDIGHVMGMRTIAEFVENDDILSRLRVIGVDYVQGYGIRHPFPLEELLNGLASTDTVAVMTGE